MSQRAKRYTNSRKAAQESRRGGGAPYWKDTIKIPRDHSRIIRLIPGQYEQEVSYDDETIVTETFEYFIFREHYHGATGRGAICSAGPLYRSKEGAQPCEGCTMFWEDVRERRAKKNAGDTSKGPNRVSLRDQYVFTAWDYGLWINVPRTDEHGKVITGREGKPYLDWVMAQPNDPRAQQYEHKFGALVAWPMGETYKDTLLSYNDLTVCKDCATCGSQGTIACVSKICGNPNCEYPVFDPNDTTLSPQQQEKLCNEPYTCPVCNQTSFINELIECSTCLQQGSMPQRASIFDIDIEVTAVPSGKGTQTNLQILNRSTPRPIQLQDPELIKNIGPLDLAKKFHVTPVGKQRELWGLRAPTGGETQQPGQSAAPSQPQLLQQPSLQQATTPSMRDPALSGPTMATPHVVQPSMATQQAVQATQPAQPEQTTAQPTVLQMPGLGNFGVPH